MHMSRPKGLQVLCLAAIAMTAAACSAATQAPPIPSPATVTSAAAAGAAVRAPVNPGSFGGDVQAACDAMVTVNSLQPPGTDPDGPAASPQELTAWATQVETPLSVAAHNTPPELSDSFGVLTATVNSAKSGTRVNTENPAIIDALATINASAYDHCGFQTLAVQNASGVLSGVPATLEAGPVAIKFTNSGDPATAAFVLLVGHVKAGQTTTLADVLAGTTDLGAVADMVAAAAPMGNGPAYAMARLTPGHYVVAGPLGTPPAFTGFIGAEFDVPGAGGPGLKPH